MIEGAMIMREAAAGVAQKHGPSDDIGNREFAAAIQALDPTQIIKDATDG